MTSKITYQGQLRTSAVHLRSDTEWITDAPVDNRGKGQSFSPTVMVATALGSCILTIMGIKAEDKGLDISGATAEITKTMASNPRRISRIEVIIQMPEGDFSEKDKNILEKAAHGCPVRRSLSDGLEEVLEIRW